MRISDKGINIRRPAVTFVVCFALLASIFIYTMLHNVRAIDYPYLWYALFRIFLIAIVTAALSVFIRRKGYLAHVFFGVFVGFAIAVGYVNMALYLKS